MIRQLQDYGKSLRQYEGEGKLLLPDKLECECKFECVQLPDGRIIGASVPIKFDFETSKKIMENMQSGSSAKYKIVGNLNTGELFEGDIFVVEHREEFTTGSYPQTKIIKFVSNEIKTEKGSGNRKSIHFGIVNLEFIGCEPTYFNNKKAYRMDNTTLNLGDFTVNLKQIENYDVRLREIKATKGVDVTAEAIIQLDSVAKNEEFVRNSIGDLCILLSFATGSYITWVYEDIYDTNGERIASYHRNAYTAPLCNIEPVINSTCYRADLKLFLEQCYPNYRKKKEELGLYIAIQYYVESKLNTWGEQKYLLAFLALEVISGRWVKEKSIIPASRWKKEIRPKVENFLETLHLEGQILEKIRDKIPELNKLSFKKVVQEMLNDLEIKMGEDNLQCLIRLRNKIVHTGLFGKEKVSHYTDYRELCHLLDQTILKIIGYDGFFLDCTSDFLRRKL